MYLPEIFRTRDRALLLEHAGSHPFATVVTHGEGGLEATPVPLLIDAARGVLRGHLARENPQRRHLEAGGEALAIFHGPHGYVSPSVYAEPESVPTWNYVLVQARGAVRVTSGEELRALLADLVERFDATGWQMPTREAFLSPMVDAIVGFEIAIATLEGKWKLSQNKSPQDRARIADWLDGADASSREVAALMRTRLDG